jgi:iron uptake system EfeUOB component EfeO/EfeM
MKSWRTPCSFELTAKTDYGSGTNLATIRANVDGTQMTLDSITPMLQMRNPTLVDGVEKGLGQLSALLDSYRHADGTWEPVEQLTLAQHQQLDGTIGQLLEQLSEIPGTLRLFVVGAD